MIAGAARPLALLCYFIIVLAPCSALFAGVTAMAPIVHSIHKIASGVRLVTSQGDITQWAGDAIVNAANERMLGGGGVDGAIHRRAGPELYQACLKVQPDPKGRRCPTGEARITAGFRLPAKHVIHTVGPIYDKAGDSAEELLSSAIRSALRLAAEAGLSSIAFPAISCGVYGYPLPEAAAVSLRAVQQHLAAAAAPAVSPSSGDAADAGAAGAAEAAGGSSQATSIREVHFVLFGDDAVQAWLKAAQAMVLPAGDGADAVADAEGLPSAQGEADGQAACAGEESAAAAAAADGQLQQQCSAGDDGQKRRRISGSDAVIDS